MFCVCCSFVWYTSLYQLIFLLIVCSVQDSYLSGIMFCAHIFLFIVNDSLYGFVCYTTYQHVTRQDFCHYKSLSSNFVLLNYFFSSVCYVYEYIFVSLKNIIYVCTISITKYVTFNLKVNKKNLDYFHQPLVIFTQQLFTLYY